MLNTSLSGMPRLSGLHIRPQRGPTDSVVMIFHGYGADGHNLISLGKSWQTLLPQTEFIALNAPFACEESAVGYQWFSLRDWSPHALQAGAKAVAPVIHSYIKDCLKERSLNPDRLVLVGFSQGSMMALFVGLQLEKACGGIVGYSGVCLSSGSLIPRSKPPVLLIHGDTDSVVPVQATHQAEDDLKAAGIKVQTKIIPGLGHSIDQEGLIGGGNFIKQCLSVKIV